MIVALLKLAQTIETYNADKTEENTSITNNHYAALHHVVVDLQYFEPTHEIQRAIFARAFQLMEDVKITEEERSQRARETACSFHRVRKDNVRMTGDGSSAKVH